MAILASLPGINLFSSLPSTPPNDHQNSPSAPPKPPIPVPKYPPPLRSQRRKEETVTPAFKTPHYRTKYYRPVKEGAVLPPAGAGAGADDRAVVIGKSGVSFRLPGAPFEFQYSYSETPKAKPVAIREPAFLPFAPPSMPRPWTGKAPLKSAKEKKMRRKTPLFDIPAEEDGEEEEGGVRMQMPRPFPYGRYPRPGRTREDVLGEPLKKWEIKMMVNPMIKDNRQVNLGRDGLTHNMLELVHSHWKRTEICKVRCKGVPTVDMLNVCRHLEEKTGGKIIYRAGGVVYLYRGRNYNYATRPQYPIMLWKPAAPVYPKLIQEAPGGLTKREADELRSKGKKLLPISKLAKNGVYITLVKDVRNAFEASPLAKIDCTGLHASDYKKIGAKLMELVPCVLLSFDDEQILMWRGSEWKSLYALPSIPMDDIPSDSYSSGKGVCDDENRRIRSSPKMVSLWKRAIESNKAMLLEKINLAPDDLLKKVEEFEGVSQANEHSYPALLVPAEEGSCSDFDEEAQLYRRSPSDSDDGDFADDYDEHNDDDLYFDSDTSRPLGSLPIDVIAKKYYRN